MRFIKKFLSLQKGGYADTCEITIRIALAYLLKKNTEQNVDQTFNPLYMAAQLYFSILFNDDTPMNVQNGDITTSITVKQHFLNTIELWLRLSSKVITVKQQLVKTKRDKFYVKTPNDEDKKNILAFNQLLKTNQFNFVDKKLKKFNMYKEFFMLTKLDNDFIIKKKILSLSQNDDKNCIETILNELKILFNEYSNNEPFNNYKDTDLLNAFKLLEKKFLEISYGDTYNNEFLRKLREYYIKDKKFPTPDISIYKEIKCTLNKLYYLRAVQKFFNLMEVINYYYQEHLFDLERSTSAPKWGTDTNTLFKFKGKCNEKEVIIDLETSLTGLNTTQILDRIDNIQNQISEFNKCFFKPTVQLDQTKMEANKVRLETIFNRINQTLKSDSFTLDQINTLKENAEFHKYNRENIEKINFITSPININLTTLNITPINSEPINDKIKSIERENPTKDLKDYLCKFKPIDSTLLKNETEENIEKKHSEIKNLLLEEIKEENNEECIKREKDEIIKNKTATNTSNETQSVQKITTIFGPSIKRKIPDNIKDTKQSQVLEQKIEKLTNFGSGAGYFSDYVIILQNDDFLYDIYIYTYDGGKVNFYESKNNKFEDQIFKKDLNNTQCHITHKGELFINYRDENSVSQPVTLPIPEPIFPMNYEKVKEIYSTINTENKENKEGKFSKGIRSKVSGWFETYQDIYKDGNAPLPSEALKQKYLKYKSKYLYLKQSKLTKKNIKINI
jgi:hypothetical protein